MTSEARSAKCKEGEAPSRLLDMKPGPLPGAMSALRLSLLALLLGALAGCSQYQLQGRVVHGPTSAVTVVDQNDPRLREPGMGGVKVAVTVDPESLNGRPLPVVASDSQGGFAVPVDEIGAGFLEYDVRVVAGLQGHQSADRVLRLPGGSKRLLITLAPGRDTPGSRSGTGAREFLDETMQLSEPYLKD